MGALTGIATSVGETEATVKLIATLYLGYVFSLIHRSLLSKAPSSLKLIYITSTGLMMMYWNFGYDLLHSLLCVVVQYFIFSIFRASTLSTALSFAFQMFDLWPTRYKLNSVKIIAKWTKEESNSIKRNPDPQGYLLCGYWFKATISYHIHWTLPQSVLSLRLIGLAFDVYDGRKNERDLSKDQKDSCVKTSPTLLEIMALSYAYFGFIVGPQFSLRRFRALLKGELTDDPGKKPSSLLPGLQCFISGTLLLLMHVYLSSKFNAEYCMTSEFKKSHFIYKFAYIDATSMTNLLKYVSVWKINDGSCVICGLGFRKDEKTGRVSWDAVSNVVIFKFFFMQSLLDLSTSFNITTNEWVKNYVYKRLKFIGVQKVSQLFALGFLALWHGLYEGYYTAFFFQFFVALPKDLVIGEVTSWKVVKIMQGNPYLRWIPCIVSSFVVHSLIAYGLTDFFLKKWHRYYPVHVSVHFYGYVFVISCYLLVKIKTVLLTPTKKAGKN